MVNLQPERKRLKMKAADYSILLNSKVNDLMEAFADMVATKAADKVVEMLAHTSNTTNANEEDELIGTREACRILGCCSKTMQSYRNRKLFRVVMRGPKKAMYYKSEILAFRAANTRSSRNDI